MKFYLTIFILFICILPVRADFTATQTFVVNAQNTITIVASGNLASSIDGFTGELQSPLHINFNITSNADLSDIQLKAFITDYSNAKNSGFYCADTSAATSQSMYLLFLDSVDEIPAGSIDDCKKAVSTAINNPNVIAYPGTISINNTSTIQYVPNGGLGYFSSQIKSGTTDLSMVLSTTPKPGTYDFNVANDEPDSYTVEIYLDNIP